MKFGAAHPCISPTTVTGALTCTTLDSLMRISFVFAQISRKRASCKSCLRSSCSIHASRSKGAMIGSVLRSRATPSDLEFAGRKVKSQRITDPFVHVWELHTFLYSQNTATATVKDQCLSRGLVNSLQQRQASNKVFTINSKLTVADHRSLALLGIRDPVTWSAM
jgi:hypothetical protein